MRWPPRRTWTRASAAVVVLALAGATGAYVYATRPARLRAAVQRSFAGLHAVRVSMGSVSFSLTDGLRIADLVCALEEDSPLAAALPRPADRSLLAVERVVAQLDPWSLLLGRARPTDVLLEGGVVNVIRDGRSDRLNWSPWQDPSARRPAPAAALPRIRARDLELRLLRIDDAGVRLLDSQRIDAHGSAQDAGYLLVLRDARAADRTLATVRWSAGSRRVALDVGWCPLDAALGMLPAGAAALRDRLRLTGRARIAGMIVEGAQVDEGTVDFGELSCAVPAGDAEWDQPPERRFMRLADARGTLRLAGASAALEAHGALNGAPLRLSAAFELDRAHLGHSGCDARVQLERFEVPQADDARWDALRRDLPHALRAFLEDYQAAGRVSADLRLVRPPGAAQLVRTSGTIDFHDGRCTYFRFPYRFEGVRGRVSLRPDGRVVLEGLRGRHGSCEAVLSGHLNHAHRWTGFEIQAEALDVPLDRDLFDALPPRFQERWAAVSPIGLTDLSVRISRPEGSEAAGPGEPDIRIDGRLTAASLSLGQGQRLTHADGEVAITADRTSIRRLQGLLGSAIVELAGEVRYSPQDAARHVALDVTASGVPVERHAPAGDGTALYRYEGVADAWGRIRIDERGAETHRDDRYAVRLRGGDLWTGDSPVPWRVEHAWLNQSPDRVRIVELVAAQGAARLSVRGVLPTDGRPASELEIRASDLPMDSLARQTPSTRWHSVCEQLGLSGVGGLTVRSDGADAPPEGVEPTLDVRLNAAHVKPLALPVPLRDASIHCRVLGRRCEVVRADARHGDAGRVSGSGWAEWDDAGPRCAFSLRAESLVVGRDVVEAMPQRLSNLLERLRLSGRLDAQIDRLAYESGDGGTWSFNGRLDLHDGALDIGLALGGCDGQIRGGGSSGADDRLRIDAEFQVDRGTLAGRSVERWAGHLELREGSGTLELRDLSGRLADGEASGFARIGVEDSSYELSLTLSDVSFSEFLNRPSAAADPLQAGRLDGYLFLRGTLGRISDRTGGGHLRIRGASLLRTPVLGAIVREKQSRNGGPLSDEVSLAEIQFVLQGQDVHIVKADIQSRDLRLVGEGTWDLRSDSIEMELVGAHPKNWPRLPVLTDVLERAGREFARYRVSGPAESPVVSVEPLHNLTDPLRRLLSP